MLAKVRISRPPTVAIFGALVSVVRHWPSFALAASIAAAVAAAALGLFGELGLDPRTLLEGGPALALGIDHGLLDPVDLTGAGVVGQVGQGVGRGGERGVIEIDLTAVVGLGGPEPVQVLDVAPAPVLELGELGGELLGGGVGRRVAAGDEDAGRGSSAACSLSFCVPL